MISQGTEISRRRRAGLLLAAWAVALLITDIALVVHCGDIVFTLYGVTWIWYFPEGMVFCLSRGKGTGLDSARATAVLVLIWLCYVWLTIVAFRQHRSLSYFLVYGLLCVLLLLNAVGCTIVMERPMWRFG